MPNYQTYKNLRIPAVNPTGDAGLDLVNDLKTIADELDTKALASDLSTLSGSVSSLSASAGATATSLSTLTATVSTLSTTVASKALASDLSTHTAATAAHGATGAVVGTTNTQTLSNKTFSGAVNSANGSWSIDGSGNASFSAEVDMGSSVTSGTAYHKGDFKTRNKADTGWISLFSRNTTGSEVAYDLTNIRSLVVASTAAYQTVYQNIGTGTAGFRLKNGGWEIGFTTNPNLGWFEMTDNGGVTHRRWDGYNDILHSSGKISWTTDFSVAGAGASDTFLYRASAGALQTDGSFTAATLIANSSISAESLSTSLSAAIGGRITSGVQTVATTNGFQYLSAANCNQINIDFNAASSIDGLSDGIDGQGLTIRITGTGQAVTLATGTANTFRLANDIASSSFYVSSVATVVVCLYCAADSIWDVLAIRNI